MAPKLVVVLVTIFARRAAAGVALLFVSLAGCSTADPTPTTCANKAAVLDLPDGTKQPLMNCAGVAAGERPTVSLSPGDDVDVEGLADVTLVPRPSQGVDVDGFRVHVSTPGTYEIDLAGDQPPCGTATDSCLLMRIVVR